MGAWSTDAFGNDTACDWANGLTESDDLSLVEAAIAAVVDSPAGYLDASLAQEALAAAEVVARLRGNDGGRNAYTEATDNWVRAKRLVPPEALMRRALLALDRCLGVDSELRELWDESDAAAQWRADAQSLMERLQAEPQPLAPPVDAISRAALDMAAAGRMVREVLRDWDANRGLPRGASLAHAYKCVLAGDATGRPDMTLEAIAGMARTATALGKTTTLQDLSVRDARILIGEGRFDDALVGLAPWRRVTSPAKVDARLPSLYMAAEDLDTVRRLYDDAIAREPDNLGPRIDRALLEARLGPVALAHSLIDDVGDAAGTDLQRSIVALVRGIVACREGSADAIEHLLPVAQEFIVKSLAGAAAWPVLAYCAGWGALALERIGRGDDARAMVAAAEPLLVIPANRELVADLVRARLLPADAEARALAPRPSSPPLPEDGVVHRSIREVTIGNAKHAVKIEVQAPRPRALTRRPSDAPVDHGAFRTVAVRGINAMALLHSLRQDFAEGSGVYPFLVGDEDDLDRLLDMIEPPADGGQHILAQAAGMDVDAWVLARGRGAEPTDQDKPEEAPAGANKVLQTPYDMPWERLKPLQFIGLCELSDPAELFARLGYGGWNACPEPHVHVALHRHWRERLGVELAALQADVVECTVPRTPLGAAQEAGQAILQLAPGERVAPGTDVRALQDALGTIGALSAAMALAQEHDAYCPDTIDQGPYGTVRELGAELLESTCWYFWWD